MDGRKQRNALTAAERAVAALAGGAPERAVADAAKAAELDQTGVFAALPGAVADAAAELRHTGSLSTARWTGLRAALPPGPLQALVDAQLG